MRDMNILEEMNDFRRLSGLLLESPGTLWLKIRSLADNYFDNVLDPIRVGKNQDLKAIDQKIKSNGLSSLTDDEILLLLSKMEPTKLAKLFVDNNLLFTQNSIKTLKRESLIALSDGSKSWKQITDEINRGRRTLWGQADNLTDDEYKKIAPLIDDITDIYLEELEQYIRSEATKVGNYSILGKLPKPNALSKFSSKVQTSLQNWVLGKQRFILETIVNKFKSIDRLNVEKDAIFEEIKKKVSKSRTNPNIPLDITSEVRRLTSITTAAAKKHNKLADDLFQEWKMTASLPSDVRRALNKDEWVKNWEEIVTQYSKDKQTLSIIERYKKMYGELIPKKGADWKQWRKRWSNMIMYATPNTRSEIIGKLAEKSVTGAVAERLAQRFMQGVLIFPALAAITATFRGLFTEDERKWWDLAVEEFKESMKLDGFALTYLDELYALGDGIHEYAKNYSPRDTMEQIGGEVWVDYQKAEQLLSGDYTDDGSDSNSAKSNGIRRYIKNKYSDIPNDYLLRIGVTNNNKVYFTQVRGGNRTQIPLALINGEIYLINKQVNKKIRFDKIWTTLNEGLINILKEQEIDWGSGEPIDDSIDLDTVDDVSTSDWSEIFGGDEDGESSSTEEDGDGETGGVDLGFLGGIGSSGTKWEFNRNPTGQLRSDRDAARLDADSYTKGNIYVYEKPDGTEELVLAGKLAGGTPHLFKVEKNESGKWGWINDSQDPPMWEDFKDY